MPIVLHRLVVTLAITCLSALAAGQERPALAKLETEIISLIAEVEPSIVSVVRGRFSAATADRANPFGAGIALELPWNPAVLPEDANFVPEQFGAGVIVTTESGQRMVLTNQHVITGGPVVGKQPPGKDSPRVYVRLHNGHGFYARIRAADPRSDLAVLVPEEGGNKVALPRGLSISDADRYKKGQIVFVFGNPYGVSRDGSASVGWGIIGNVLRQAAPFDFPTDPEARTDETIHHYGTLLQLDCRVDLGFSGGATVNRQGELIGLTTSLAALEGYESTTGFAIPFNDGIRRILRSLLQGHEPEYGFLGVGPTNASAEQMRAMIPGWKADDSAVLVELVKPGSSADQAGLRARDVILSVGGEPIASTSELFRVVGLAGPGAKVPVVVLRHNADNNKTRRLTMDVRLDKWPVVNVAELVATVPQYEPWRGLAVDYATGRAKYLPARLEPYPQGVVVVSANEPLGTNDAIGPGDFIVAVNQNRVDSPKEFYSLVRGAEMVTLRLGDGRRISVPEK